MVKVEGIIKCWGKMRKWLAGILATSMAMFAGIPAQAQTTMWYVTGYTCDPTHGQPYCGRMSDGMTVYLGAAACPNSMMHHMGTVHFQDQDLLIVCRDTYAAYLSQRVDVWWPTIPDCYAHTGVFPIDWY